ncbi:MAG: hypothetical protein K2O34_00485 [Acetatifactor sp.]|nr:hypothetical protein [Acetatifactor sp.]
MREVLNYPQIDTSKIETVKKLIEHIVENPDGDDSRELTELKHITGKIHSAEEFFEYWGWTDLDTVARLALTPKPPCIRDLSRDEVKDMVSIIKSCLISGEDSKAEYYIELLHKSLPLADVMNRIMSDEDEDRITDNLLRASSESIIAL